MADSTSWSIPFLARNRTISARIWGRTKTADWAHAIAACDLNRDGKVDLATVGFESTTKVAVHLNETDPGSATPRFYRVPPVLAGSLTVGIAAADFNMDGAPDLALANNVGNGTFTVLLNETAPGEGTTSFAAPLDLAFTGYAETVENRGRPCRMPRTRSCPDMGETRRDARRPTLGEPWRSSSMSEARRAARRPAALALAGGTIGGPAAMPLSRRLSARSLPRGAPRLGLAGDDTGLVGSR